MTTTASSILRGIFNGADKLEKFFGPFPIISTLEVSRLINVAGNFVLDAIDGRPFHEMRTEACEKTAAILVDALPTGTAVLRVLHLRDPLQKATTHVALAAGELAIFNFKGAWEALKTGKVPAYDGGIGYVIDKGIGYLNRAMYTIGVTDKQRELSAEEPQPQLPSTVRSFTPRLKAKPA